MHTIAENPPPVGSKIHIYGDGDFDPALAYEVSRTPGGSTAAYVRGRWRPGGIHAMPAGEPGGKSSAGIRDQSLAIDSDARWAFASDAPVPQPQPEESPVSNTPTAVTFGDAHPRVGQYVHILGDEKFPSDEAFVYAGPDDDGDALLWVLDDDDGDPRSPAKNFDRHDRTTYTPSFTSWTPADVPDAYPAPFAKPVAPAPPATPWGRLRAALAGSNKVLKHVLLARAYKEFVAVLAEEGVTIEDLHATL